ncbi:MAG: phenylalanine--tRNA ligase subunit beta [Clostridiales bacterium]|nr:phenylalanine--tRNA ligase subunit beta [Clostridiales bacterium]
MLLPLSWLKDYVEVDCTPQELQAKLFGCGFEVEELIEIGKDITGVVVGEVTECEPVEGTHLHVCKVDCGGHGIKQICCGADNVAKGIKAPVALVGATVYATAKDHVTIEGVMTIKKGKLRGIDSEGMLCSGVEIGVNGDMFDGGDYCGLLLLPKEFENGADVKPLLGLDDFIFDIGVTANRPDCQSIVGMAREVAAVLGKKFKEPDCSYTAKEKGEKVTVSVIAPDICPRYIAHYVKDVRPAPSPLWLRKRLNLCGLRSINNLVDITNFILLEMGQPMHAFDCAKLDGREIVVRRAAAGEEIVTLDGKSFKLTPDNLVICDGNKPCALAGVMGGENSEITDGTRELLFESAKFARDSIRKTSRALGQHSDSSALFEKGINEYTTERAMARALHLIEELGCGTVTDVHVDVKTEYSHDGAKEISVSLSKINSLLGIEIPAAKAVEILKALNFGVEQKGDTLDLQVPPYREDIDGYADIAEELIREYGYEHVTGTFMPSALITNGGYNDEQKAENSLKDALVAMGLYEISTYSFYSEKDLDMLHYPDDAPERKFIKIKNPIGEDLSVMRTTLAPSMVNVIVRNLRRGNTEGKLFELAKIYVPEKLPLEGLPEERKVLCIGTFGNGTFFDIKGILEGIADSLNIKFDYAPASRPHLHPGICAEVSCGGEVLGYLGRLDPKICEELAMEKKAFIAELDYKKLTKVAKPFKYVPLPKHPEATRDLALVADLKVTCAEIENCIYAACKYVTEVKMFDIYVGKQVGEGKKSLAFTVTFTPKDEAFTPEKIDGFVKKILGNLKYNLGVELR